MSDVLWNTFGGTVAVTEELVLPPVLLRSCQPGLISFDPSGFNKRDYLFVDFFHSHNELLVCHLLIIWYGELNEYVPLYFSKHWPKGWSLGRKYFNSVASCSLGDSGFDKKIGYVGRSLKHIHWWVFMVVAYFEFLRHILRSNTGV